MTTFNTTVARTIANKTAQSSFVALQNIHEFLISDTAEDIKNKLIAQDVHAIADSVRRHGGYQVFGNELNISLSVNGSKVSVLKVPGLNIITFILRDKKGFTKYTKDVATLRNFIVELINDKDNISMFSK